jgi:hypothetical protein
MDLFDKATWPEGKDFSYLKEVVMTEIVPMASHQHNVSKTTFKWLAWLLRLVLMR